ncbi:MMPL family transporter [Georgenia sp. SYP-B2076]|uniref:MMPL family transporter n=1 Tax=Georgenia sp. SYP-B2076 TaxID=2495881 RepID=UPI001F0CA537|nr:MMPL family transporter [Georgenia sp. SYP-B2076]
MSQHPTTEAPERPHRTARPARRAVGRAVVLVLVLAAWLAVGAFGGMTQGKLSQVQQNDQAAFLPASAESTRADELSRAFTDTATLPALVVLEASDGGTLSAAQLAAAQDFAAQVPGVTVPGVGALGDQLVGPVVAIPSEDGRAVLVPISLDAAGANEAVDGGDRLVIVVVDGLRALAGDQLAGTGLDAWVTGPAGAVADLVTAFGGIDGILLGVALAVVLVILLAVYRSPVLPFTVLLTAVFAVCAAGLVIYPLAGNDVLLLNGQSQGILSILVIGAATDYSLLLVARYREELTRHARPVDAMRVAWRASVLPILASAGTVIAGLLCLLLSDLGSNSSLGPVGAIGIAASVLAALTLLPAMLLVPGRRARAIFWPRTPQLAHAVPGAAADAGPAAPSTAHVASDRGRGTATGARRGLWQRVADLVARRDRPVWVVTVLVLLAAAAFVPTFRAQGTSDTDVFLGDVESVRGEAVLADHFDAGLVQPVTVITAQEDAAAVVAAAQGTDGVLGATVRADGAATGAPTTGAPAPGAPTDGGAPVVVDGNVQVQVVTEAAAETQEAVATVRALRAAVHEVAPDALVGGAAAQRLDTQETAAEDLRTIIPAVLLVIFVMLVLLLRSFVAPLVLLVANVLSFGATMGLSAIVFNHVLGFPGADATVPLYGFVFLVALGIDYSIFLMTRVREESLRSGTREGVRRGLAVTGGVITSAGLVLAATFSALAVIPLLFLAQLAFIVAAGVLVDTLVVRSLLVPGAIHDLGRRAWWPFAHRVPRD